MADGMIDWRTLIGHSEAVQGDEPTDTAFERFRGHKQEYMAVLDGQRPEGVCARREIGMLLGGRYGYALFARKPARAHMAPTSLSVSVDMTVDAVLRAVFSREAAEFYDDVILVDSEGLFLGLIHVHTLVRLQTSLLEAHVEQLQAQRREIANKNEQMEMDLALAREMQLTLLPRQFPAFPPGAKAEDSTLRFAHHYLPSTAVSGDLFHVFPLGEHRAGVFICDVMGHGVRSALITAMMRVLVQEACTHVSSPGEVLARVNRGLIEIIPTETGVMFVTAAYAIFDAERRSVSYASAGHPAPLHLMRGKGTVGLLDQPRCDFNPALGIFPQVTFGNYERSLEAGDIILFYTDGLFEVDGADGTLLSVEGLAEFTRALAAEPLPVLVDGIVAAVRSYAARGFDDDVCLLAAEIPAR
ncbi:protein serine/threonine phosphatase [Chthoniobacter flavus Ellin428]|uniref:Protein serine/threonine phosphatase n=2 Tax=Chthoniobacter flavus TaxID=191863 RepID=B4CWY5_9BACT|nr:protein serine/threonine phosphatase [Chthoniobacter flavus Ellin428]TCO84926.1 serine phosphatase RsbU (regulator of sigma subunit) [Chthoniobacter flavus]